MSMKAWMAVAAGMLPAQLGVAQVLHVDDDAPLGGDGQSWQTAYRYLQDALYEAQTDASIEEIRIAAGTYRPDQDESGRVTLDDPNAAFRLHQRSVSLIGGFNGYGSDDPDGLRDLDAVLTGTIGDPDDGEDNSRTVLDMVLGDPADVGSEPQRVVFSRLSVLWTKDDAASVSGVPSVPVALFVDRCGFHGPLGSAVALDVSLGLGQASDAATSSFQAVESRFTSDLRVEASDISLEDVAFEGRDPQFGSITAQLIDLDTGGEGVVSLRDVEVFGFERFRTVGPIDATGLHLDRVNRFYGAMYPSAELDTSTFDDCIFHVVNAGSGLYTLDLPHAARVTSSAFIACSADRAIVPDLSSLESVTVTACVASSLGFVAELVDSELIENRFDELASVRDRVVGTSFVDNDIIIGLSVNLSEVSDLRFVGNTASEGPLLGLTFSPTDVTRCEFIGNLSGGMLAGRRFSPSSDRSWKLSSSRFENNVSWGPMIDAKVDLSDSLVAGHVVLDRTNPLIRGAERVLACTIIGNATGGPEIGFIDPGPSGLDIDGSIIRVDPLETLTLHADTIRDSVLGAGVFEGVPLLKNTLLSQPVFVDEVGADGLLYSGDEDWTLAPGSPGIDLSGLGLLDGIGRTDLAGTPRFVDSLGDGVFAMDAGALERQGGTLPICETDLIASGRGFAPDGVIQVADLTRFVEQWVAGNPATDITTTGAVDPTSPGWDQPDRAINTVDLTRFVERWLEGCP
ncbi:MAG: GC-type dockerin domain-anchored protein [Planctomycetota bacterium]